MSSSTFPADKENTSSSTTSSSTSSSSSSSSSLEDLLTILCKEIKSTNWIAQQPSDGPNIFDLTGESPLLLSSSYDNTINSSITVDSLLTQLNQFTPIDNNDTEHTPLPLPHSTYYTKTIPITETRTWAKIEQEIHLQTLAYLHGILTPKLLDCQFTTTNVTIRMEKLPDMCLADKYGDNPSAIPSDYWDQIRHILYTLLHTLNIEYVDITPYNFVEVNDRIHIIDFGDAYLSKKKEDTDGKSSINYFLQEVLDGHNGWNPDFR